MAQRRKNMSEKDIRTIMAVIDSVLQDNDYSWEKLNRFIGSMTLEEMFALRVRLAKWYDPEGWAEDHQEG